MDDGHLLAAIRYVENNPVTARLVPRAEDWRWSSAKSHVAGRRAADDVLTDLSRTDLAVSNWSAMLRHGWEVGDADARGEALADAIEARLRTGRPLAAADWIARMEAQSGRTLAPQKPGLKRKGVNELN